MFAQDVRQNLWRKTYMNKLQIIIDIFTYAVCVVIIMISIVLIKDKFSDRQQPGTYNCSIAEISPDFTPAMREVCRKLRREQQ
jgi:hypothetical protein